MKKILLALALFAGVQSFAQNANEEAVNEAAKLGYGGSVGYKPDAVHTYNINYSITPRVPKRSIDIMLHTPEPRPLSLAIVNKAGKVVANWTPTPDNYILKGTLDISKLPAGAYTYRILWDGNTAKEIPFQKK